MRCAFLFLFFYLAVLVTHLQYLWRALGIDKRQLAHFLSGLELHISADEPRPLERSADGALVRHDTDFRFGGVVGMRCRRGACAARRSGT